MWDARNSTELAVLRGHEDEVSGVAFPQAVTGSLVGEAEVTTPCGCGTPVPTELAVGARAQNLSG